MGSVGRAAVWIALATCVAPVWGRLLWEIWDGIVRPRLVRRDIIDRAAAAILAQHGDRAEEIGLDPGGSRLALFRSVQTGMLAPGAEADRGDAAGRRLRRRIPCKRAFRFDLPA